MCEVGGGGKNRGRRGSTWWTAGLLSQGLSSGSSRIVNVILSSHLLETQQPKLCSCLTFQKHRLIQLLCLSPLRHPHPSPPLCLFPSVPFYLAHFFPVRVLQLLNRPSIASLPTPLSFVMYLFLMATVLQSACLYITCGWVESKVNRSWLNPSRSLSSSSPPKQTLKPIKGLILFSAEGERSRWIISVSETETPRAAPSPPAPPVFASNRWLHSWIIQLSGKANKA